MFAVKGEEGKHALDRWLGWTQRCRIPVFVKLAQRIRKHRPAIDASLDHGLSNGLWWRPAGYPEAPTISASCPVPAQLDSSAGSRRGPAAEL